MSSMPSSGMTPDWIGAWSTLSRKVALATTSPTTDSTEPIKPATTASSRNGSWVYQRVAPTSRMMPTSVLLVYADTWIVLEISNIAASAWINATAKVAFRMPLSTSKNRLRNCPWSSTLFTPGLPVNALMMTSERDESVSLTRNDEGNASGRASLISSG